MQYNEVLVGLKTYEAGKPIELVVREFGIEAKDIMKLASNENPRGSSPLVIEAIKQEAGKAHLYPDDSYYELKDALAKKYALQSANIIIGAGSDQIISFALHAKANNKSAILMARTTFAMYEIYGKQTGATILKTESHEHDLNELYDLYQKNTNIAVIFLCLPNNPLGECLDTKDVYDFLDKIDKNTLVVIDGAYQEYAAYKDKNKAIDVQNLIEKYENVIYLGTFSKAYGLGGMRCGYGIANAGMIHELHKLRSPFNITTLSLKAAIIALSDQEFVQSSIALNFEQMKRYEAFAKQNGFDFIQSYTNFITLRYPQTQNATQIATMLLKKGIIIRDLASYGLNALRVTIGTSEQNTRFFETYTNHSRQ
ncbi:MAG: histidinol-phosphate transaminase [Sulfurospirillum sp.]|nr:histidinol-phosphate transaminase [Sulfurospirillum sp.]